MALEPGSAILTALYHQRPDEANRLADEAKALTIWEAAALGRDDRIRRTLDGNASLANAYGADGNTPLGLAAFFGHPTTVRLLLDRGADASAVARNYMKVQPLHAAVAGRNSEAVALLLEAGADANARQQVGYTPLMAAAGAGREDLVDLLLRHGADPSVASEDGKTAAALAREHEHEALAARLTALVVG
jgi:ankyrin repeat protein